MHPNIADAFITAFYQYFLFRDPEKEGLRVYSALLSENQVTSDNLLELLKTFATSDEFSIIRERFFRERLGLSGTEEQIDLLSILPYLSASEAKQQQVLVTGLYRSGTSALVSLLNFSSEALVTHEVFDPTNKTAWTNSSFSKQNHLLKGLDEETKRILSENISAQDLRKTLSTHQTEPLFYRLFPEVEISNTFDFPFKKILLGKEFAEFGFCKIAECANNYEALKVVGDKLPRLSSVNVPLRMMLNNNLTVVFMIRDPVDALNSALEKKRLDQTFEGFLKADFWEDVRQSYLLIGKLMKLVPDRVIGIKYEGFFESEARIAQLIAALNLDPGLINWSGVRYLGERSKFLSEVRHERSATENQAGLDDHHKELVDQIMSYIDWTILI